jgi:hypothetical protein
MRKVPIAVLTVLAAVGVAAAASAASPANKAQGACRPGHPRLIIAGTEVQVYAGHIPGDFPEYLGFYGCVYGSPHSYGLGTPYGCGGGGPCGGTRKLTLAGPTVAYERYYSAEGGPSEFEVIVRNLRTGQFLHKVPTGTRKVPNPEAIGIGGVVWMVVKPDGAVAWIAQTVAEEGRFQLHAVDATGSRVLATGASIDPTSLALAGSTLYWRQASKTYSTELH